MGKYKICVYAISKNEEKYVKRWVNSMKEADEIYVLDTGSTDKTVELLKSLNVKVFEESINPWRFDIARNKSLDLLPLDTDICVCTDLDEVFEEGWREKLENIWSYDTNKIEYTYNWSIKNGVPNVTFYRDKIHDRSNYKWVYPVHEVLVFSGLNEVVKKEDNIILNHFPDYEKSRSSYLELLELSVKENPFDDRNLHYLGREYMYYGRWNDCIDTLIKHLNLNTSTWKDERCASMRFIARAYYNLGRIDEAKLYLEKAINEAPYLRDPYMEMALFAYNNEDYEKTQKYCLEALKIKTHAKTYINETFTFDNTVYDLLSIASFYLGKYDESLVWIDKAIEMESSDRLVENKKIIEHFIKKNNKI